MSSAQKWIHPKKNLTAGTWKEVPGKGWKKEILFEKPIILRFHVEFWESIPSSPPPSTKKVNPRHLHPPPPSTPPFFFSQGTRHHLAHFLPKDLQGEKPWMCLPQVHLLRQPWLVAAVVAWEVPGRWMFVTWVFWWQRVHWNQVTGISLLTLFCEDVKFLLLTPRIVKVKGFLDEDLVMDFWDPRVFPATKPDKPRPWRWQPLQPWLLLVP